MTLYELRRVARFWVKVDCRAPDDCWEWRGPINQRGYGAVTWMTRPTKAHRLAWELANDQSIPEGLLVCHSCDNRRCCNPSHLWLGSVGDNTRDAASKGRLMGRPNHPAKLTLESVTEIRRLYAAVGTSHARLAARFGVSESQVRRIVHGERSGRGRLALRH